MTEIERLAATVEALTEENDDLHEAVNRLIEEAKDLLHERQEAREWAEAWRDRAFQAINAEGKKFYKFPWEWKGD